MATLQGRAIKDTYKDLLQVSNGNAGVDATVRTIEDGEGTSSALGVSTSRVKVGGEIEIKTESSHDAYISKTKVATSGNASGETVLVNGENNFQGSLVTDSNDVITLSSTDVSDNSFQFHCGYDATGSNSADIAGFFGKGIASAITVINTGTLATDGAVQASFALRSADSTYPAGQGANFDLQTPYKRINFGHVYEGQLGVFIQNVDDRNVTAGGFYPSFDAGMVEPTDSTKTVVGLNLGTAGLKWKQVYASTATIATSDENTKTQIEALSDAEKNVAVALKGLVKKFKFKSAVAIKGENARTHIGLIAQEVEAAFSAEGLNARDYSLFCEEKWYECTDSEGKVQNSPQELPNHSCVLKTQLGIRYEEVFAFIISTL